MIINKVILNNFFRYYGRQEIDCKVTNDKNVIVIIGKNGRGKTTLLSAFQWAFYGKVNAPLTIENMMNDNRLKNMQINEGDDSFVEIEFWDNDKLYRVRRSQYFVKESEEVTRKKGYPKLCFFSVDSNGNTKELSTFDNYTSKIIPEKLSGFFFFDGERIDRLAKVDGRDEIKQAILDTLGITTIENSEKDLKLVEKTILMELKKYTQDESTQNLSIELDELNNSLDLRKNDINKFKDNILKAEELLEECNEKLRTSNSERVKKLEKLRRELEDKESKFKNELVECNKKICNHITKKYIYYLISKNCEVVDKLLEEKREKGQLPSNIKITFIDDIIKRGTCICGGDLNENLKARENVLRLKENAGKSELDEAYTKLKGLIDNACKKEGINFYEILNDLIEKRNYINDKEELRIQKLEEVNKSLGKIDIDDIKTIEKTREEAKYEIDKNNKLIGSYEEKIVLIEDNIKRVKKKMQESESKNIAVSEKKKLLATLYKVEELNLEFKNMFIRKVREELDERIKKVFANITNKHYRIPELNEKFELKIMSSLKESEKEQVLSTGEGQITSLSFIGALVSYARDSKHIGNISTTFLGDDYPIVMDSPFGNLDENHTENVAKNIGSLASQVIIIVSNKQWKGHVEDNIIHQVNRKYEMIDGNILDNINAEYTVIKEEI